jgi:predicted dehydrogenase
VAGVGAFGRNHARVYHQLHAEGAGVDLAGVADPNMERAQAVAAEFQTRAFPSLEALLAAGPVDAASVATPTAYHLPSAATLLESGAHVLIEKPLAGTLADADAIAAVAQRSGRIAMVGHLERFNPAVRAALPLVSHPMFFEVHRLSVFAPRSLDVDVVLDLMIHDLDVVLSFTRSKVTEVRAVGLPVISPQVDIANARLEFESGCVANFTASRVSTERVRKVRFFQPHQYISIDYGRQDVISIRVDEAAAAALLRGEAQPQAAGPVPGIKLEKPPVTPGEPLRNEIAHFLDCVRSGQPPEVPIADGRAALALALEINQAIREHRRVIGESMIGD